MDIECTHDTTGPRQGRFSVTVHRDADEPLTTTYAYGPGDEDFSEMDFHEAQAAALAFYDGVTLMFSVVAPDATLETDDAAVIRNAALEF